MTKRIYSHIPLIVILFFAGLLVFKNFFNFSLWGDDWMLSFYILEHRIAGTIPRLYFSLYGGQALLMDIMNHIFKYDPNFYYYVSYILRFIAGVSIYIFTFYISQKKLAAFFAALFFLTSFAGIESTNWVHNSINYFALALFLIGFLFWIKHQRENKEKVLSKDMHISLILYTISIILAAVRMNGLLLFAVFSELYLYITRRFKLRNSLIRIIVYIGIFGLLYFMGLFGSAGSFTSGMLNSGIFTFLKSDSTYIFKFVLYPFGTFANLFFPTKYFSTNSFYQEFLINISFGIAEIIFFSIPILFLNFFLFKKTKVHKKLLFLMQIIWILVLFILGKGFGDGLGDSGSQILIGLYMFYLFIISALVFYAMKKQEIASNIVFLLAMSFFFVILTHLLLVNQATIETFSRYLTVSAGAVSVLVSYTLFSLYQYKRSKNSLFGMLVFFVMILFLLLNNLGNKNFFENSKFRFNAKVSKVWESINYNGSLIPYKGRIRLFVFDFKEKDRDYYQTAVGFGGTYRYAIENNIRDRQQLVVFLSKDELGTVVEAFKDPTYGARNWGPAIKDELKIEDIHGFILNGENVIPVDAQMRSKIMNLKN